MTSHLFVDSTALLDDPSALRRRAEEEGYLFFKGLLPAEEVRAVQADVLGVVEGHSWRKPGQGPLGGTLDLEALDRVPEEAMRTDIGVSLAAYRDVQKLESVHRLPHHPKLLAMYRTLFGGEVLVHARHIVRMITAHPAVHPTPPHQDFPHIQGTTNTWTCWFPVGDCPRTLGGLTVLRASHRLGFIRGVAAKGAGGIATPLCPGETDWVEGDYVAGDVLTFPSLMVHKALRCQQRDQIRISFDVRYQPMDEVVEPGSLRPHVDLDWETIYAGWERAELKYYWKSLPLRFSTFDPSLPVPGERRIC